MTNANTVPAMAGMAAIADRYDGFILDLWGCLHDGLSPYPGTIDALRRLRALRKRVVILSNAPRRAGVVAATMAAMGLTEDLYDEVLSSGEEAWLAIASRGDPFHAALGRRCLLIGPERDRGMVEGNGLEPVASIRDADFILVTGPRLDGMSVADHEAELDDAKVLDLKMLCANPDFEVMKGTTRLVCAGALALKYEQLGGVVRYHGKPYPSIYALCLGRLAIADRRRVLAVGDALRTDIAGAASAGIDSAFIPGGIHGPQLGISMGELPEPARLARLYGDSDTRPSLTLAAFRWSGQ